MKRNLFVVMIVLCASAMTVNAGTMAYWRFEDGPVDTDVIHSGAIGQYSADIQDVSGNGNHLSTWQTGSDAGYAYRSDVGYSTVPGTGMTNNFSVKNTGGGPAMWCNTMQSWSPAAWTIEATFRLENNGNKTIVGRDSYGINSDAALAALYLQVVGNNALAIKFCDVEGYWHEAVSADNAYVGFNWSPENPDGEPSPWYSIAAVSDGSTLSLYLNEIGMGAWNLIAQTDMTASGSANTALTAGADHPDGRGDWDPGDFTVGRGLHNGNHVDRGYGFIDEVRISDTALTTSEFLVPEPATLALLGLGALLVRRKK